MVKAQRVTSREVPRSATALRGILFERRLVVRALFLR